MTVSSLLRALPPRATLVDVSARDGLQAQARQLSPEVRAEWVRGLLAAGIDEVEACAFVHPRKVPQMAQAGEVLRLLTPGELARAWALVPNLRGVEAAAAAGARNALCLASATRTHSRNNLGRSIEEVLGELPAMARAAREAGMRPRVALSVAWGDPDEGPVPTERAAELCRVLHAAGFDEITLCDTYGAASPDAVAALVEAVGGFYPPAAVGLHFHDTFGLASANVLAGLLCGVSRFDASVNGLGGCPFLPGARGNLDTAHLLRLLRGLGVETAAREDALQAAAAACAARLGGGQA